jgi:hypothetical protein
VNFIGGVYTWRVDIPFHKSNVIVDVTYRRRILMGATLTAASGNSLMKSDDAQGKEMVVLAKCIIKVGYVCTVYYPNHDDPESYENHEMYHEQNARVIRIHEKGGVDLEMTTGPARGKICENVAPTNLFFWGPFSSSTGNG